MFFNSQGVHPFFSTLLRQHAFSFHSKIVLSFLLSFLCSALLLWNNLQGPSLALIVIPIDNKSKVQFKLDKKMKSPIYVYYEYSFYKQNHRSFISSLYKKQLKGQKLQSSEVINFCGEFSTNKNLIKMGIKNSWGGFPLKPDDVASPCGIAAFSYVQQSTQLKKEGQAIQILNNRISWPSLRSYYKRQKDSQKNQWVDPQSEQFINWMQFSAGSTVVKFVGRIMVDIPPGTYSFSLKNKKKGGVQTERKKLILKNFTHSKFFINLAAGLSLCLHMSTAIISLIRWKREQTRRETQSAVCVSDQK